MQIVAIDIETTGKKPGYHELTAICCIAFELDTWKIGPRIKLFSRPLHLNRITKESTQVNGFTIEDYSSYDFKHPNIVRGAFCTWVSGALENKEIIPLGHNYQFDKSFLEKWIGKDTYDSLFHYGNERDTKKACNFLKDRGELPKNLDSSLMSLTDHFHLPHKPHDVESDTYTTILLYKKLINLPKG